MLAGLVLAACGSEGSVTWEAEHRVNGRMAAGATLVLTDGGTPAVLATWTPVRWPEDPTACAATRAAVLATRDVALAAWWSAGRASTRLLAARSWDGGLTWQTPVAVGTADPRSPGCRRPPPGLGVDAATGTLHLAFHGMVGDTAGVVDAALARSATGTPSSLLIAIGGTPRLAAVAAAGDTVAVAFESPSAGDDAVWLAISLGKGHIPRVLGTVTPDGAHAFGPMVAIRNGRVAVAWNESRSGSDGRSAVAKVGRFKR